MVFLHPLERSSSSQLRERYLLHRNSIEDKGYCEFLGRVIQAARPFIPAGARGLDYGCGPVPTLSKLCAREGLAVSDYDPLFCNAPLEPPYDFIFATECFEHFEEPRAEIRRVVELLGNGGVLALMTELWDAETDFARWHYASDLSHVSFFAKETLDYLCRTFGLCQIAGDGQQVFVFRKAST